ncbi:hypothetical protein RBSH_05294 [Rhodopirellula baltica SH28]|uniref:Uncharacterized protein n=1 Tax=Rhodopirellula baltica SH28 TaxID=993517 RepID=K5E0Y2_RHOBT|nr:hypothetical protein RBSH_05294 [Rhodopirellula baltica SH28]
MVKGGRLANGQSHRSQGHRPWDSNQNRPFWPTAKFNQSAEVNLAFGQSVQTA